MTIAGRVCRFRRLRAVSAWVLFALLVAGGVASAQQAEVAAIKVKSGRASVQRTGESFILQEGQELALRTGDVVGVSAGKTAVLVAGGELVFGDKSTFAIGDKTEAGGSPATPKKLNLDVKKGVCEFNMPDKKTPIEINMAMFLLTTSQMTGTLEVDAAKTAKPDIFKEPSHVIDVKKGDAIVTSGTYMMHVNEKQSVTVYRRNPIFIYSAQTSAGPVYIMAMGAMVAQLEPGSLVKIDVNEAGTAILVTNLTDKELIVAVPWSGTPVKTIPPGEQAMFLITSPEVPPSDALAKLLEASELFGGTGTPGGGAGEGVLIIPIQQPTNVTPGPDGSPQITNSK